MPTYCYRKLDGEVGCEKCSQIFELVQKMSDAPITHCDQCGAPVERIIAPYGVYFYTDRQKQMLSDKNLSRMGFTKLVREEKGVYRKTTTSPEEAY